MNKTQLIRFIGIKRRLRMNSVNIKDLNIKDLIKWCEDYKVGKYEAVKGNIGRIMFLFTLKYDDVLFFIYNLEEIKIMENNLNNKIKSDKNGTCS